MLDIYKLDGGHRHDVGGCIDFTTGTYGGIPASKCGAKRDMYFRPDQPAGGRRRHAATPAGGQP
jgi:hypothetical protein